MVPAVRSVAHRRIQTVRCPDRRYELVAEAVAISCVWYRRLMQKGRDPAHFAATLCQLVARAVHSCR